MMNPALIGFEAVESKLTKLHRDGRLHHAILLQGKKGIGKASFAREFVAKVLGKISETKDAIHPDLLLIEKESEKKEITVDKIRKIADFANQTSAISPHKFIIIDSACELNKSASNALLKILEEPHPNNFLVLIAHNLGRVLPTIKSRCQIVKIENLNAANFEKILRQKKSQISSKETEFLSEICDNSIAEAIEFGADLTKFYELFLKSISGKKLEEEFLKKTSDKNFPFIIFEKISQFFFSRLLQFSAGAKLNFFFDEQEVFFRLSEKFLSEKIFLISAESLKLLAQTTSLNLDKKLSVTNIFNKICHD